MNEIPCICIKVSNANSNFDTIQAMKAEPGESCLNDLKTSFSFCLRLCPLKLAYPKAYEKRNAKLHPFLIIGLLHDLAD